jgi:hypothetical protein
MVDGKTLLTNEPLVAKLREKNDLSEMRLYGLRLDRVNSLVLAEDHPSRREGNPLQQCPELIWRADGCTWPSMKTAVSYDLHCHGWVVTVSVFTTLSANTPSKVGAHRTLLL